MYSTQHVLVNNGCHSIFLSVPIYSYTYIQILPRSVRSTAHWKWGGCSHNVNYGIAFSEMFLDTRETGGDIQSKINLHNNHAGRLVLTKSMQVRCKCHGMSGSCQMKTCWKSAPDFHVVGSVLKQMFRRAVLVDQSNKGNGSPLIIPRKRNAPPAVGKRVVVNYKMRNAGGVVKKNTIKVKVDAGDFEDDVAGDELADMGKCEAGDKRRYCENARRMEMSLFYFQRSPNFCERDRSAEILGELFLRRTLQSICELLFVVRRNDWPSLQSHGNRKRWLLDNVLRTWLHAADGPADGEVSMQVPLVLPGGVRRVFGRGLVQFVQLA